MIDLFLAVLVLIGAPIIFRLMWLYSRLAAIERDEYREDWLRDNQPLVIFPLPTPEQVSSDSIGYKLVHDDVDFSNT